MIVKVVLWIYEFKKNGICNIKIYVNIEGKKKYFCIKFFVLFGDFDVNRGLVKKFYLFF